MCRHTAKAFHGNAGKSNWAKIVKFHSIRLLGTGQIIEFFYRAGMTFELIDKLKRLASSSSVSSLTYVYTLSKTWLNSALKNNMLKRQ